MAKKPDTKKKTEPVVPAKRVTKPVAKSKPVATKAKPAAPVAKVTKSVTKPAKPKAPAYTPEDVALRAYFIAEKRRAHGLPGDEHQDWIEAERQLAAEAAPPKKTKKA